MRCSVLNCAYSSRDSQKLNSHVTFHRFPKESSLKAEWIIRCNRQGNKWNPDTSYICSEHFTPSDYNQDEPGGSRQEVCLKPWAIPSQNLPDLILPVCLLVRLDSEDLKEISMKNQVKVSDLTVDELKVELKKRKIAQVGPKVALIKRLKKALTDQGEDPDNFTFTKDSDTNSSKDSETAESSNADAGKIEVKKSSAKSEADEPKREELSRVTDDVDTPKRTLRRSTREKSPVIQFAPSTPTKTPRVLKGKKLLAVVEEDEAHSKEVPSESKQDDGGDKKPPAKKEVKKETKKPEETEPKKESPKVVNKEKEKVIKEKQPEKSPKGDEKKEDKGEEKVVNGDKDNSPEKKDGDKKSGKKSVEKDKCDKENGSNKGSVKEDVELEDEDAKQAELDLDLEDMEQPDYEEELNFDCGSTFISDNDADLDEGQDDSKSKESSSKKARKSGGDKKEGMPTMDTDVSEKPEGDKDTEEDNEKIKSSDKSISDKEDTRDSEKGADGKDEGTAKDLWVTGLSSATKAADLKQAFLKHGKVISTKIVMNPKIPGSQCFGIVTVASQEDALTCVKALNVTELLGRFITVKIIAKKKDKDKKDEAGKKRKEEEGDKDKSMEKKDLLSPKKDSKDSPKTADEKERERERERDIRRPRDGGIRKRLGPPRPPFRRATPPFVKRRQEMVQEKMRRREMMERKRAMMDRRMVEEATRQEVMRLSREREMLRLERERIVREKAEILRLERERIEREKEEIRKQHMRLEEVRRKRDFNGPRDDFDSRPNKRPINERHYDRRQSPAYGGGQQPYRRDDRQGGGRFDSRDRYEGGGDRRHDGWRDEGRGGGSGAGGWSGDKGNDWSQPSGPHERNWNSNSNKGGYNNSGMSRGGGNNSGYNRGGPGNNMGGQSNMNPYPPPQQHNFNPYPPPKY